jgi:hypothetical protein
LKDRFSYSLAILGFSKKSRDIVTYGPHILVTNKINIEQYSTYIEGQIDISVLDQYSDFIPIEDLVVRFKYRVISISKKVHEAITNTEAEKLNEISRKKYDSYSKLLLLDSNYKEIINFINIIPLTSNFKKYGLFLTRNYVYKIDEVFDKKRVKRDLMTEGSLFKYKDNIHILIYAYNLFTYKGIVFKNGYEYYRFTDIIIDKDKKEVYKTIAHDINDYDYIEGYDLIRVIKDHIIYIKNEQFQLIEKKLKGKLIKKDRRDINYNKKIGTFDIECYKDYGIFASYACK